MPYLDMAIFPKRRLSPLADRGPLRVLFVITSMPVGGMETLLVELIRRLDRSRFEPELCCLKYADVLGEKLADEIPVHTGLLKHKYDCAVLWRLTKLLRQRRIDAVVTVGAGDKMFWGRLAGRLARVPVVCSALHSTGWPDRVQVLNRLLAPLTDAFIAVAEAQGRHLADKEGCPAAKIRVIPNGIDVERFHPRWPVPSLQDEFSLVPGSPVVGIVAALRPEKNHELFLQAARRIHNALPSARFLIVGDGPRRAELECFARDLGIGNEVRFTGARLDVPELLSLVDVVMLTSRMEASPASILEAMACEKPVVATRVGSLAETVLDGRTGYLVTPGDAYELAGRTVDLLCHPDRAAMLGRAGREHVIAQWSVDQMVKGYQDLIAGVYESKASGDRQGAGTSGRGREACHTGASGPTRPGSDDRTPYSLPDVQ
jgi:glycosyltransferase involved in cell wall biosynthesis